jgi:hypothetical protein
LPSPSGSILCGLSWRGYLLQRSLKFLAALIETNSPSGFYEPLGLRFASLGALWRVPAFPLLPHFRELWAFEAFAFLSY